MAIPQSLRIFAKYKELCEHNYFKLLEQKWFKKAKTKKS
jgi:hypothetical protein